MYRPDGGGWTKGVVSASDPCDDDCGAGKIGFMVWDIAWGESLPDTDDSQGAKEDGANKVTLDLAERNISWGFWNDVAVAPSAADADDPDDAGVSPPVTVTFRWTKAQEDKYKKFMDYGGGDTAAKTLAKAFCENMKKWMPFTLFMKKRIFLLKKNQNNLGAAKSLTVLLKASGIKNGGSSWESRYDALLAWIRQSDDVPAPAPAPGPSPAPAPAGGGQTGDDLNAGERAFIDLIAGARASARAVGCDKSFYFSAK